MNAALAVPLAIAALAAAHSAMAQQPAPGETAWRGRIHCGIIPGLTTKQLNQRFTLIVDGGRAHYSRPVRQGDSNAESGYVEQGGGMLGPDGTLHLSGGAQGRTFRYTATYDGRLPPGGGSARLLGSQQWSVRGSGTASRACRINLAR